MLKSIRATGIKTANRKHRDFWLAMLFVSPFTIGFLAFNVYPVFMSLYYSLTNFNIIQQPLWVGFNNYLDLFSDPLFWKSCMNTLYLIFIGIPAVTVVGLGIAVLLSTEMKGIGIFRTLIYVPSVVPPVAVALVWIWILNPNYGLINAILSIFHINGPGWLGDPDWSKPAILLMVLWGIGNVMVLYLAAIKEVPVELREAAQIDGAKRFRIFTKITLPSISNVVFYNIITGIISFTQFFTQAYVVGGASGHSLGAPSNSTLFYGLYLYQNAFGFLKMGLASAMGWILLLFSLIATWILLKYSDTFRA